MNPRVLIVGAGPVGLITALALNRFGVKPDIIDKKSGPGNQSRAMAVVPGTVEHYCQLGIAEEFLEESIIPKRFHLRTRHLNIRLPFKIIGEPVSRFGSPYIFPQDEHEKYLIKHLCLNGLKVKWEHNLNSIENQINHVSVKIDNNDELIESKYDYIIGCDGGSSTVRKIMDGTFSGETNEQLFYVSDVSLEELYDPKEVEINFLGSDFLLNFPLRGEEIRRLIGIVPDHFHDKGEVMKEQFVDYLNEKLDVGITKMHWFSEYKIHHRVSKHYQYNRVFLAGDAAHIHSPVGGQGLNAGVVDAINLSWKLAGVLNGHYNNEILSTYEEERREYALGLVEATDRAFKVITYDNKLIHRLREIIYPFGALMVFDKSKFLSEKLFGVISQMNIEYESAMTKGNGPLAGKRLPYFKGNTKLNDSMIWHIQVYGKITSKLKHELEKIGMTYYQIEWEPNMKASGLKENTAYLIRPDGYIAWASEKQDYNGLKKFLLKWFKV